MPLPFLGQRKPVRTRSVLLVEAHTERFSFLLPWTNHVLYQARVRRQPSIQAPSFFAHVEILRAVAAGLKPIENSFSLYVQQQVHGFLSIFHGGASFFAQDPFPSKDAGSMSRKFFPSDFTKATPARGDALRS